MGMREGTTIEDYFLAAAGDETDLSYDWTDKPHRLVYDLCMEFSEFSNDIARLLTELALLFDDIDNVNPSDLEIIKNRFNNTAELIKAKYVMA